jgi:hypothetical protein
MNRHGLASGRLRIYPPGERALLEEMGSRSRRHKGVSGAELGFDNAKLVVQLLARDMI